MLHYYRCNLQMHNLRQLGEGGRCCIDKTSSAELSQAINSMYRWYQNCDLCIAYLEDIRKESLDIKGLIEDGYRNANIASQLFCYPTFSRSRWFKRGWTLQELIAPLNLYFYDSEWNKIGEKQGLLEDISQITRIDRDVLRGQRALSRKSVAHKMAWASRRETTRVEDLAYCLIGIFEINMPLLCGEGQRAFTRLQQEIMKHTYDHSLFAWNYEFPRQKFPRPSVYGTLFRDVLCFSEGEGVLAPHPSAFDRCSSFMPWNSRAAPYATTNRGLQIHLRVVQDPFPSGARTHIGLLKCDHDLTPIGLPLARQLTHVLEVASANLGPTDAYFRPTNEDLVIFPQSLKAGLKIQLVYLHETGPYWRESTR
jgi:hypothetical protein